MVWAVGKPREGVVGSDGGTASHRLLILLSSGAPGPGGGGGGHFTLPGGGVGLLRMSHRRGSCRGSQVQPLWAGRAVLCGR